jgi:phosphonate transport system ATP-binding protein
MNHLKRMAEQRGICCIVNLHQVDFARRYASRIIGVKSGSVVFDGKPEGFTEDIARVIYEGKENQMALEAEDGKEAPIVYAGEYAAV